MTQKRQNTSDRSWWRRVRWASVRIAVLALLTLAGGLVCAAVAGATQPYETYENAVAASGPVAQFRFDDPFGSSTIQDSVGSHTYTATNNNIMLGQEGPFAGSKSGWLSGATYAPLPSNPLSGTKAFSAEVWVDWNGGTQYKAPIFNFGSGSTNYMYLTPASSLSEHKMLFEIHPASGSAVQVSAAKLKANAWEYLAVTETSAGTITLYLNAEKVAEVKESSASPASLGSAPSDYLGKALASGEPNLEGSISNLAFYTSALPAAQVAEHYADAEFPVNTAAPTVSGTAKEGKKLKAKEGTWTGETPITYSYQWQRCYEGKCEAIAGAKEKEYGVAAADVGYRLRVLVTAENATKTPGQASSAETATVEGVGLAPTDTELPKLEGEARETVTLKAGPGRWEGTPPISYTYQWERCNALGETCASLSGATASSYTVGVGDVGYTLRAKVTAKGAVAPSASATSATSAVVVGKPVNTELPQVEGEAREGQEVKATAGKWGGTGPLSYEYQWEVCSSLEVCFPEGTGSSLRLTEAQLADTLRVKVTATNALGSASATSAPTAAVKGNPPNNTQTPTVSGEAREGQTLQASEGEWTGTKPITYSYNWRSCNAESKCTEATGASYQLAAADVGNTLAVEVTAKNPEGSASATSAPTAIVKGNPPVNTVAPTVTGEAREGQTLSASEGKWEGTPTIRIADYTWLYCSEGKCTPIPGASGPEVSQYHLPSSYVGDTIEVQVTAENAIASATETSPATAIVAGNPPKSTEAPQIAGEAREGQTLSASEGTWEGSPTMKYSYQWERGASETWNAISGATESSYTAESSDAGKMLRVEVTAENTVGSASGISAPAGPVLSALGTATAAWGDNYPSGQLGVGYHDNYEITPAPVPGLSSVRSVVAAGNDSYALLGNGTVRARGDNPRGSLGDGSFESSLSPVPVDEKTEGGELREMTGVTEIAAAYGSYTHGMALVNDSEHEGEVMTWGASEYGERGNGEYEYEKVWHNTQGGPTVPKDEAIPVVLGLEPGRPLKHIVAIAAGGTSDFALQREGGKTKLRAWGQDHLGKLGLGAEAPTKCDGEGPKYACSTTPAEVDLPAGVEVTAIGSGRDAAYAVLSNGRVLAWGGNSRGELGNGTTTESNVPHYVCAVNAKSPCGESEYLEGVVRVAPGNLFALALKSNGEALGWGSNEAGQLSGTSPAECQMQKYSVPCQKVPKVVAGLEGVTALSAGAEFSLALNAHGEVRSFGSNEKGQLGDGTAKGPELCEKETKKKEIETTPCGRVPRVVEGLTDVGGISAGGAEAGEGHSLVYVLSGSGPTPAFSVTAKKHELALAWTIKSSEATESEYHVRWRQEPPRNNPNREKAEKYSVEEAEYKAAANAARAAREEAEEAGETAAAEAFEKEETEDKAEAQELAKLAKEYESAATKEYKTESEKITEKCKALEGEWCFDITKAFNEHKEFIPLTSTASYWIQLGGINREGASFLQTTVTPLE